MSFIEFTGARRIPLIGRRDLLKEAERRIGRGGPHLLYLEGGGGIGKTALLETILEQSQRGPRADDFPACCVASEIVDLYHADVHTSEGLIRRMCEVLGRWSFERTEEVLADLDRARLIGDMDAANRQAKALREAFVEEFNLLAEDGVVLALDTLEVLEHERDPFQEELGAEVPILSAGEWLFKSFLPAVAGNVMLLLAGRPANLAERLEAVREANPQLMLHHTVLEALGPEETEEYLLTVAQAEGKRGDGDAAARLWAYGEERSDVVHYLTGGRPILLALVADMVAHGWALPSAFNRPLEEILDRDLRTSWAEIERALVVRIQDSPTPIGDTIRALAWLRKGATPELLARVLDLRTADGQWDVYTVAGYLEQVTNLALIKVRPGTRSVFLHDEMYTLLDRYILDECSQAERDRVYEAIRGYYRDLTRDLEQRIERSSPMFATSQAHLRQAYVEEMHYRLRHMAPMGFAMYFWLAEEALGGRDSEMDMLLRAEFLRTLATLETDDYYVERLLREAEIDMAVRWGMRALFLYAQPEAALHVFDLIRRRWGKDAGRLRLVWAHMQLYRAVAKIQRADGDDWPEARTILATVEQAADEVLTTPPDTPVAKARRWRARILKSLARNYQGYLDRQQGRYLEAVRHYQESAMLQRRLGMSALAPTLTNLAYALAQAARLLAEEAERLARRSGKEHMLALTLNVRALVEEYDSHHKAALRYTDRALEVATRLPTPRVPGLIYLTRARAHRYLLDSFSAAERERDSASFEETLKEANLAVNLLRNAPADRVEALLERGCVYRDLARAHYQQNGQAEARELFEKSQKDLERVAILAGIMDQPRQQALAWTNLGWLYYYSGWSDAVDGMLDKAFDAFPEEYRFPAQGPLPAMAEGKQKREATLPYWSTLGKAEMLRGFLALDAAREANDRREAEAQVRRAVKHITLSLAYDELVADAYFDLQRAEEGLHKRILQDNLSIKALHQYAAQFAAEQELDRPTRFQQFLDRMFGPADLWT